MQADPWQVRNLATDPGHVALKCRLRERLEKYLRETDDPRSRGENPFDYYPYRYRQKEPLVPRKPENRSTIRIKSLEKNCQVILAGPSDWK